MGIIAKHPMQKPNRGEMQMSKKMIKKKAGERVDNSVALQKFKDEMNKKFGSNAIMFANEVTPFAQIKIPTGSVSLDLAMGGGVPIGRFVHLSGLESTFKSTTLYRIIANVQKMAKEVKGEEVPLVALLINSETGSFTPEYGEHLGIDVDKLILNQCNGMEEALEIAHYAQKTGLVDFIGIDSIESLVPIKEYDSAMDDTVQMGIKPKLLGEYLRKFSATNNKLLREGQQPCTVVGINQLREKIGAYGDALYSPGGNALRFHASVEVRFRKGDVITKGEGVNRYTIGQVIKFKVNKNKVGVPLKTGSFDIYFDEGGIVPPGFVDTYKEIVLEGIMYGVIEKAGSWLSYKDIKVQGVNSLLDVIKDNEELYDELYDELLCAIKDTDEIIIEED